MRLFRGPILVLMLVLMGLNANAQVQIPTGAETGKREMELLQWGVTQGGLVLVVLVVVWSYRRDFQRVFDDERRKSSELLLALQASTTALTTHAEVLRENSMAAREQAKAMSEMAGRIKGCELAQQVYLARGIE